MEKNRIKFENLDYTKKRGIFRKYSKYDEIEKCVDVVADEIDIKFKNLPSSLDGFELSWNQIVKYLVDGYLAFEVIYDNGFKKVIGLKELDVLTLVPAYLDGKKVWYQYPQLEATKRVLYDGQVIYISYSDVSIRQSYVESLYRPFHIMKTIEHLNLIGKLDNGLTSKEFTGDEDVEYVTRKFYEASRIPPSYHKFEDISMNYLPNKFDERFDKFIDKHFKNLAKVYSNIDNIIKSI